MSQAYLAEDWTLYPKFGHHTGVDYGAHGEAGIPAYAAAQGEIIYRGVVPSSANRSPSGHEAGTGSQADAEADALSMYLGNHCALYLPEADTSLLYCHLAQAPHGLGRVRAGERIGIMGNTGESARGAIHLHLEGFHGRFTRALRQFTSLDDIRQKTFDADAFIRAHRL